MQLVYGRYINGNMYMFSHMKNGQSVVANEGRMFFNEAPTTEWSINLPIARIRNGQLVDLRWHDLTLETMDNLCSTNRLEYELLVRTTHTDESERIMHEWEHMFPLGMVLPRAGSTQTQTQAWSYVWAIWRWHTACTLPRYVGRLLTPSWT